MKVVINKCYGGFGLSDEAKVFLKEMGCSEPDYLERNDPLLVQAVEFLGTESASDDYAKLVVIEIPDGIAWEVNSYDGMEKIVEQHRDWY
jgi:hypothetical protein